ncbi:MAG: tetratricopeptide repeat protein [Verrucomicrobiota bacterium]
MDLFASLFRLSPFLAVTGLLLCPLPAAPVPEEQLMKGQYQEITGASPAAAGGAWAFARFFLLPDRKTYEAAWKAREQGDPLGKFTVMRAHQAGEGVKRDQKTAWRMNVELREALGGKTSPTPLESYILSYLSQADGEGRINVSSFPKEEEAYRVAGKSSAEHLRASADGGCAQAMDEIGESEQADNPENARRWYRRAAEAGLASGMKNLGFMLAQGAESDPPEAIRWTRMAAEKGNIFAMLNMAAFHERLHLPGLTEKDAVEWVERGVASGHPLGFMEKGLALLMGHYGMKMDEPTGKALLQQAAATGSAFALRQIAAFYLDGTGVTRNCAKAAEFARAAWQQGAGQPAARILASAYRKDPELGGEKNEAKYWEIHSMGNASMAYALNIDARHPDLLASLAKIDPFSLKIK